MIEYLSIDLETKSGTDLSKSGVYRYTEDPEFEILLFGYSVNGGEVSVIDVACGEQIPEEVLRAIVDESVTKWAFNAAFERICLSAWLRKNRPTYGRSPRNGILSSIALRASVIRPPMTIVAPG